MRCARTLRHIRPAALSLLLAVAAAACSDDDPGPPMGSGTVMGVFTDSEGNPIRQAPINLTATDTSNANDLGFRTLTTNAAGQFSTTFEYPVANFPVKVLLRATPPMGSGMRDILLFDSVLALPPGRSSDTLAYALHAIQEEPSVIGIPAAPLDQAVLRGNYSGKSVPPQGALQLTVFLDLAITATTGSVSGRYDIDYSATTATPAGTIVGAVLLDTLRLQLTTDTIPDVPVRVASLKAIATSASADTLIAWPDPCDTLTSDCWLGAAPIRLVRTP